jgi:hypothetical protein
MDDASVTKLYYFRPLGIAVAASHGYMLDAGRAVPGQMFITSISMADDGGSRFVGLAATAALNRSDHLITYRSTTAGGVVGGGVSGSPK